MSMRPHSVKFTDADWTTLKRLKDATGARSVGEVINEACARVAERHGMPWHGGGAWGDPLRFERAEIAARGMPPLADDDFQCPDCQRWHNMAPPRVCPDCGTPVDAD